MARVKSAIDSAKKWRRVASTRGEDYKDGVTDASVDWSKATLEAKDSYNEGVQAAINRNAFSRGVESSGTEHWRKKTVELGTGRYGPGITAAEGAYQEGISPFVEAIDRLLPQLPKGGPRGDPRNADRSTALQKQLHELRLKL